VINQRDLKWDAKIIVVRDQAEVDSVWDGSIKNLVYNADTMEWEAQTNSGGAGGGGGPINAATSSVEVRSMPIKIIIDEFSDQTTYIGEAAVGTSESASSWRIKRLTLANTITTIEWASGNALFNKKWIDRDILTYS
jgi:hypothetical protein